MIFEACMYSPAMTWGRQDCDLIYVSATYIRYLPETVKSNSRKRRSKDAHGNMMVVRTVSLWLIMHV